MRKTKIGLIEPQCVDWQHEMVNAGMLQLVADVYGQESIVFCAEDKHINNVFNLANIRTDSYRIDVPLDFTDFVIKRNVEEYYKIGKSILNENDIDIVLLLSSNQCNMHAFARLAKENPKIKFIVVVHAIMEWLLFLGKIERGNFRYKQKRAIQLVGAIRTLSKLNNVCYISYSPYISKCGKYVGKRNLTRFVFMHHPYPVLRINRNANHIDRLRIGVLGACINETAMNIVDRCDEYYTEFIFFNKGKRITREHMNLMLEEVDCLLIPYDKDRYRVSASGVLFDAVNYGIPLIGLDSPILKYYNDRFDIGWLFGSVESLCSSINQNSISREELRKKEKNMSIMRDVAKSENIDTIRRLFYEDLDLWKNSHFF